MRAFGRNSMGEPGVGLARARGAHRHVERERQHLGVDRLRAPHQIEADLVIIVPEPIELQPEHIGRGFRRLLDGGAAGDAERVGHARALAPPWPSADRRPARPATARPWAQCRSAPRSCVPNNLTSTGGKVRHHAVARHDLRRHRMRPNCAQRRRRCRHRCRHIRRRRAAHCAAPAGAARPWSENARDASENSDAGRRPARPPALPSYRAWRFPRLLVVAL